MSDSELTQLTGLVGYYYHGSDGAITCAACDCEAEVETCEHCEDGMSYHDCGEDCCCCADPWPNVPCDMCNGRGFLYYCDNPDCPVHFLERRKPSPNKERTGEDR